MIVIIVILFVQRKYAISRIVYTLQIIHVKYFPFISFILIGFSSAASLNLTQVI